jgi:Tfp pilus assembly protein PilF
MTFAGSAAGQPRAEDRAVLEGVSAALQKGDIREARRLAEQALAQGLEHGTLFSLRALGHTEAGRHEEALKDLRKAHFLAPNDFAVLNALGLACGRLDRLSEAVACYDKALAINPGFAPVWFNRGAALERLGELAGAAESYDRATELEPKHLAAWANSAWVASRRGDAAAAQTAAEHALALDPDCTLASLALAAVELDRPEVAERRLRKVLARPGLAPTERALALGQLGDALDRLNRPAIAFDAYVQSNQTFRDLAAPRFGAWGKETAADAVGWMIQWAEKLDAEAWRAGAADVAGQAGEREHVFLLGFPRSGTTLVESLLGAHPDVVTLEERGTLNASIRTFLAAPEGLERLAATSSRELQSYRDDYWRSVAGFGADPKGKIFIDKNPFGTLRLPLIWKLFPQAKVIFAVRDPRDVVFSCFRRRFDLNPSTYELLDLGRAARFYDAFMRLAELLREKQPLAEHRLVYERLIDDFEGEARAVCAFIGADWRPDLDNFAGRGRRGGVASASAAQISRGLFSEGVGQWRRYAEQLAPALPLLSPWVERFGYPAD